MNVSIFPGEKRTGYKEELYAWRLLENEKLVFTKEFKAVDQQVLTARWTVIAPKAHKHSMTVIMLHGRADFPQRLARRVFDSPHGLTLRQRYPQYVLQLT